MVPVALAVPMLLMVAEKGVLALTAALVGVMAPAVRSGLAVGVTATVVQEALQLLVSSSSSTVPTKEVLLSAQTRTYLVPTVVKVCETEISAVPLDAVIVLAVVVVP